MADTLSRAHLQGAWIMASATKPAVSLGPPAAATLSRRDAGAGWDPSPSRRAAGRAGRPLRAPQGTGASGRARMRGRAPHPEQVVGGSNAAVPIADTPAGPTR